ncbi:hypothetical protein OS175_13380 [Marinicella sp. S1101]|uniref:hypothetical protein n=1 Tax=Marinicella marina TaxID=2996016 RepID=UPI002260CB54|nr:hypothetical protein [Marinicella marina]MCX7554866.1 hypothetical protein [Marinicella marina]MDJ1141524.1 hypothetical protein [Marinicella marina]
MKHKHTDKQTSEIKKHEKAVSKTLWIIGGLLFFLPGLFGEPNAAFIGIGIMFMIFGFTANRLNDSSSDDR